MITKAQKEFKEAVQKLLQEDGLDNQLQSDYVGSLTNNTRRWFFHVNSDNTVECVGQPEGARKPDDIYKLSSAKEVLEFVFKRLDEGYVLGDRTVPNDDQGNPDTLKYDEM